MDARTLTIGRPVRLCSTSPIESEGVAPGPGHAGVLVEPPASDDGRRCWGVRFDGLSLVWRIPESLLEPVEGLQSARSVSASPTESAHAA